MNTKAFIQRLDHQELEAAIADAESRTSGEIRVLVHRQPVTDAVAFAQSEFLRLGMANTRDRNGVLIFVAPASQAFALIGDEAVHQKCGDAFWRELAATVEAGFRREDFTGALIGAIASTGGLLALHFPRRSDDTNELSNQVIEQ